VPVYAVIVLIVYGWTITWFSWRFPGWLLFLKASEILIVVAYALATNFAESLAALCVPLLLSPVLPKKSFRDVFVARGAALAIAGLAYLMFLTDQFKYKNDYPNLRLETWVLALPIAAIPPLVYLAGRITWLRKILESFADRATIFLYITVPLSILSVLAILVRAAV
jgi:hypothetical protein